MKAIKKSGFSDQVDMYTIVNDGDARINEAIERLGLKEDYKGPSIEIDAVTFAEIYKNNYYDMAGDVWSAPRVLTQTAKSIFTGKEYSQDELGKAVFLETCKQLHEIGWYHPILELIVGMTHCFEEHSFEDIEYSLDAIEIREGFTVAQFCQEAYQLLLTHYNSEEDYYRDLLSEGDPEKSATPDGSITVPDDFNIFHCTEKNRADGLIRKTMLGLEEEQPLFEDTILNTWMQPLFGAEQCERFAGEETIDELIDYMSELAYQEAIRTIIREKDTCILGKDENEALETAYQSAAALAGNRESFRYQKRAIGVIFDSEYISESIKHDTILKIMEGLPSVDCALEKSEGYSNALERLLFIISVQLDVSLRDRFYWLYHDDAQTYAGYDTLFFEADAEDEEFVRTGEELFEKWPSKGLSICEFIPKIIARLDVWDTELASSDSFIICGLLALYVQKDYENAIQFIVDYSKYLKDQDDPVWNILITRCFSYADHIDKANVVLGNINEYELSQNRLFNTLNKKAKEAVHFLTDLQTRIKGMSEVRGVPLTIDTELFSDGEIEKTVSKINKALLTNEAIEPYEYSDLFLYTQFLRFDMDGRLRITKWGRNNNHTIRSHREPPQHTIELEDGVFTMQEADEFYSMQKAFDDLAYNSKLLLSGKLLTGVKSAKLLSLARINELQDQEIERTMVQFDDLKNNLIAQGLSEEEVANRIGKSIEILNERNIIKDSKWEAIHAEVGLMEESFLASFGIESDPLCEKLGDEAAIATFNNFLITSERVFKYLSKTRNSDRADFSAALISMTKALELTLNNIYKKAVELNGGADRTLNLLVGSALSGRTVEKYRYFMGRIPHLKDNLELGPAVKLFTDGSFIDKNNSDIKDYSGASTDIYSVLSLDSIIDCEKLRVFQGHAIQPNILSSTIAFRDDCLFNRRLLGWGLDYVRDKYRNKTGHSQPVVKTDFENCKDMLIQGMNLLWILLYIMK